MGCGISKFDPEEAGSKFESLSKRNVGSRAIAFQDASDGSSIPNRNKRKSVSSNKGESNCQVQEVNARKSSANHNNNNNGPTSVSSPVGNKGEPDLQVQEVVNAKKGEANCNERRSVSSPVRNEGEFDHHQAQAPAHQDQMNAKKAAADNCKEGSGVGDGRKNNQEVAAKAMTAEEEKGGHRKDGHEEDEEPVNDRDDKVARPGSPSFRDYCISNGSCSCSGSGSMKGENEDRIDAEGENESPRENNNAQAEGSLNSEMGSEQADSTKKRRSVGKGIRNAMYGPAGWISRQK